ncbi:MAG TPA: sugar phosphate nucleotidyltransferase, partial [Bacteroidales bacterium]|nr:sugar phosphate nucleotidyltransferase [Bacteroidales bacterium]
MNALLLSAGLGTRLRPLTNNIPKALIEVNNEPILKLNLDKLYKFGISRVIVNVHYLSDKIIDYIKKLSYPNMEIIISDESEMLLDTGGALLKAKDLFIKDEPILIHNVDILSDTNLSELLEYKNSKNIDALLVVQNRANDRKLIFDSNNKLVGWVNHNSNVQKTIRNIVMPTIEFGFSGISLISYNLLQDIPYSGTFSIINLFLNWSEKYNVS